LSIREKLQKNPSLVAGFAGVVIIAAVVSIVMQARSSSGGGSQAFYSADDGQTYFADSKLLVVPFDKGGKQVVRAHVFRCGGKPVVGYLERYTPAALKVMEDVRQAKAEKRPPKDIGALMNLSSAGIEVKKPGAGNPWIRGTEPAKVGEIRVFKCPGEKAGAIEIDPS
jgi:hypothetical protein